MTFFKAADSTAQMLLDDLDLSEWDLSSKNLQAVHAITGDAKDDIVRAFRGQLLADTDWTQVSDAPVDQAAWAVYRQALRDIPQQEGFPESVVWPSKP